jgi:hypothetical protein
MRHRLHGLGLLRNVVNSIKQTSVAGIRRFR